MRKAKALVVLLLIASTLVIAMPKAMAAPVYRHEPEAWQLHRLGLYAGASLNSFNPDLGAILDRQVGITLLLNFFGLRADVESLSITEVNQILNAYSDQSTVSSWARPYMAYAVKMGIVMGTSNTTLSPFQPLDGMSFAAMILRRLGYTVSREVFLESINTLYKKGGLNFSEVAGFNKAPFLKNDAVGMVYTSLYAQCSDGTMLLEKLVLSGAVPAQKAVALKLARYTGPDGIEVIKPISQTIPRPSTIRFISASEKP